MTKAQRITILIEINVPRLIRYLSAGLFAAMLITQFIQSSWADTVHFEQTPLIIHTTNGDVAFQVELASTAESRRQGLMFREQLAPNEGMLFVYNEAHAIAMWMKNTLIPLDMLFITDEGLIARIETNTEPLSLQAISSGEPVRAVLELNGGTVESFAIQPGDRVSHKAFAITDTDTVIGVARVIDGDTLWVSGTKVRLYNIDAPELAQECRNADGSSYLCGQLSKHALSLLTSGRDVQCVGGSRDKEGLWSGTCFVDSMNINKEMVARGWAVVYRLKKYDEDYLRTARIAKKSGRGMWRGDFVMPWDWRNGEGG